ncbi:PITH domain-containing protein [Trichoderma sp. SZMC 28015]|uniref:PITH domain-containing protein n=1 Tax=Trichoderma breve TaxID=2034170 RepID=A0A9W9B4H3_9HYPO|nr:PITH domain-containing protein [Trichoderma breve]KAJ4855542.1 PITH domain-containing protein [Trichoderma breve]
MTDSLVHVTSKAQFDDLLSSSRIVVADFYADWCAPCKQIAPLYASLAEQISRPNLLTFVKIDNDANQDLAQEYGITALPTFLLFRSGKVIHKVQGANPTELRAVIEKLASELESLAEGSGSGSGSGGIWKGAEIPRGYSDITDQVELRGCELLNADDDAGPVKVLFESSQPSALREGASAAKDWVQSGSDDQLLLFIPFQSTIKLHTLQITSFPPEGNSDVSRPGVLHLFINRTSNMDFGEAEDAEPTQAITLEPQDWNADGTANISLRFVKFQKTTTLTIFVQKGDGEAETVRIDRIKLIGEAGAKRDMGKLQKMDDEE